MNRRNDTFRQNLTEITGYFIPSNDNAKNNKNDSDEDEDDDDYVGMDFSCDSVFASGSFNFRSNRLKKFSGLFHDVTSNKKYVINGAFAMTDPWWQITCQINSRNFVSGFPWYCLRTDKFIDIRTVSLFLKRCGADDDSCQRFCNFIVTRSMQTKISFSNLKEVIELFQKDAEKKNMPSCLLSYIEHGIGQAILNSLKLNHVFRYYSQLFPKHFQHLVANPDFDDKKEEKDRKAEGTDAKRKFKSKEKKFLEMIDEDLQKTPWIFAFGRLIGKKYHLYGMEASIADYYSSGLFHLITEVHIRDAIHIYHVLKEDCRRNGHTYLTFMSIRNRKFYKDHSVKDWTAALNFLEENEIVVCEPKCRNGMRGETKVFIYKYWYAEHNVAEMLHDILLDNIESKSLWSCDLDWDSPYFERIKNDEDQKKAAMLINEHPIVVLSGKGGCGKTEVVSQVFAYIKKQLYEKGVSELPENAAKENNADTKDSSSSIQQDLSNSLTSTSYTMDFMQDSLSAEEYGQWLQCEHNATMMETQKNLDINFDNSKNEPVKEIKNKKVQENITHKTFDQQYGGILMLAPTGRAANLLSRRSKIPAYTLHHVQSSYHKHKQQQKGLKCDKNAIQEKQDSNKRPEFWKHANVSVLVVDECSLVSVSLFNDVVKALYEGANLSKIVLLGDVHQLPSIEPGNFLADIYQSLDKIGCSHMLKTNHRAESQCIIDNANRILQRQCPRPNPSMNFHHILLQTYESDELHEAVQKLLRRGLLPDHTKNQFIAFRRDDCKMINELCCKFYCNHSVHEVNKKGKKVNQFCTGDKVCCTKNSALSPIDDEPSSQRSEEENESELDVALEQMMMNCDDEESNKIKLCNGQIFIIKKMIEIRSDDDPVKILDHHVTLSECGIEDPVDHTFSLRELRSKCGLAHAWARTIHTFQGSEAECVIYVVGRPMFQTLQHVYTAVTRGRKSVAIVTNQQALEKSVTTPPSHRNTTLNQRLQKVFNEYLEELENDKMTQSSAETSTADTLKSSLVASTSCSSSILLPVASSSSTTTVTAGITDVSVKCSPVASSSKESIRTDLPACDWRNSASRDDDDINDVINDNDDYVDDNDETISISDSSDDSVLSDLSFETVGAIHDMMDTLNPVNNESAISENKSLNKGIKLNAAAGVRNTDCDIVNEEFSNESKTSKQSAVALLTNSALKTSREKVDGANRIHRIQTETDDIVSTHKINQAEIDENNALKCSDKIVMSNEQYDYRSPLKRYSNISESFSAKRSLFDVSSTTNDLFQNQVERYFTSCSKSGEKSSKTQVSPSASILISDDSDDDFVKSDFPKSSASASDIIESPWKSKVSGINMNSALETKGKRGKNRVSFKSVARSSKAVRPEQDKFLEMAEKRMTKNGNKFKSTSIDSCPDELLKGFSAEDSVSLQGELISKGDLKVKKLRKAHEALSQNDCAVSPLRQRLNLSLGFSQAKDLSLDDEKKGAVL